MTALESLSVSAIALRQVANTEVDHKIMFGSPLQLIKSVSYIWPKFF